MRVFEAGDGVGGTWYWNRYPGARFDSESWTYGYSFSDELLQEWDWKEHFSAQPETLRYCNSSPTSSTSAATSTFNSRVVAAATTRRPTSGRSSSKTAGAPAAQFLITAIGPLSAPTMPRIAGIEDFRGEAYHTGRWPHQPVDFKGKRVAVIGTGATGIQAITEIAKTVGHLTVFQRTPNWCAPLRNSPIDDETQARHQGDAIRRSSRAAARSPGCFIHMPIRAIRSRSRRGARGVLREALRASPASASGWGTSATC